MPARHPAKFSPEILEALEGVTSHIKGRLLDPFAGTGKIHQLERRGLQTIGIELEPEWAEQDPRTLVGNSLHMPFPDRSIDAVATSPCYGNRLADHHNAQDGSRRNTYTHALGRELTEGNAGAMQFGPEYKFLHLGVYMEMWRVLKGKRKQPNVFINMSNHIRGGNEIDVTGWHVAALEVVGYVIEEVRTVETQRLREGENWDLRCEHESIIVARKPA